MAEINKNNKARTKLLILGVHLSSEGYPNVKYRLDSLKNSYQFTVSEINHPIWSSENLGKPKKYKLVHSLFRGIFSHLAVFIRYLSSATKSQVYIPYPATFVSVYLSLLPRQLRPKRICIDAFISLYDTVVIDRKILKKENWIAQALKAIERQAFKSATLVITDTELNSHYYSDLFQIPLSKFVAIPLATDEEHFTPLPYVPYKKECNVLFVGTLVPLHGIDTILTAIEQLKDDHHIKFTIIGNGQDSAKVEQFIKHSPSRITWVNEWLNSKQLAQHIHQSDICLGIFGSTEKTQRVCPLKFYLYASCGKAIITAETDWSRHTLENTTLKPFETTPAGNGLALAKTIKELTSDKERLKSLGNDSRNFYDEFLSNSRATSSLEDLMATEVLSINSV